VFEQRGHLSLLLAVICITGLPTQIRADGPASKAAPATIHPLKAQGIDNFYQLSERLYSGSAPEGAAAFAELQKRGVKTIITVDGAKPDADTARRYGIRYVHLPIGYDGVPAAQGLRLVKAAETLPGPIYVHCHHGLHRGPAGAAVICMAVEGWTPDQADAWLHLAGTATNYPGLYRSVEQFHPPSADALKNVSNEFPEKSPISPLADGMVQVDGRFDNLKLIKKAGYKTPSTHPDLDPAQEALLLDELFKELLRSPGVEKRPAEFKANLSDAEHAANALHQSLANSAGSKSADAAFQSLNETCAACHKRYRN
jgi:hypothetical protein